MKRHYFEICIGSGTIENANNFWMCICGVRTPTVQEANQFYADDVARFGGHVLGVFPIDKKTAKACYDFSDEKKWPIFGR